MTGIYKITSPTGRIYIGQAKNLQARFKDYKKLSCKRQFKLYNSLKKHGAKNHQFDIIEYCKEDELNCSERFWQEEFDVIGENGLNLVLVESSNKRRLFSKETKKIQGERQKGSKNHRAVKIINVNTNEIYNCMKDVLKIIGDTEHVFYSKMQNKCSNNTPFIYLKDYKNYLEGNIKNVNQIQDNRKGLKLIDTITKKEFKNISEASKHYGYNRKTLQNWVKGVYPNKSNLIYL